MSQYGLAKAARRPQSYIARIENGQIPNPGVSIAIALASALNTTVEELFSHPAQVTQTDN